MNDLVIIHDDDIMLNLYDDVDDGHGDDHDYDDDDDDCGDDGNLRLAFVLC